MEENKSGFIFLSNNIEEGDNVFTEHISENLADQAIKNYLDFSNAVMYRAYLFRYENGSQPWDTWKMMEDPMSNWDLYKKNNIKYVVVPNNNSYKDKFLKTDIISNIFENDTLIIFKIDY